MSKRNKKQRDSEKNTPPLQAGDRLRMARESRGLSIEDVAAHLKLDVGKISALEQGEVARFAAPVFAAGYLRAYARLLALSETEVLADFTELASMHEQTIDSASTVNNETYGKMASEMPNRFSMRDKPSRNYLGMAGFAGAVVLVLVYFLWPVNESVHTGVERQNTNPRLTEQTIERVIPVPGIVTEEVVSDAVEIKNLHEQEPLAETDLQAVVTPKLFVEQMAVVMPEADVEALAPDLNSELILIFNSDSWAEVQDAQGQRLIYRLGKSGTRSVAEGVAPFTVQLGYVQGVDILYNGAAYDLSQYANRRSVRLQIGAADEDMGGE